MTDRAEEFSAALERRRPHRGRLCRHLDVLIEEEAALDQVRDCAVSLGVGLLRIQPRRHALAKIFSDEPDAAMNSSCGY